jgi:DNA-binding NarL/FixJ family response regulator
VSLDRSASRLLQLILIEADPVLRLGLLTGLSRFADLQVAVEAETGASALRTLADRMRSSASIDVILLDLENAGSSQARLDLDLPRQLKTQYPNLPILLIGSLPNAIALEAMQIGAEGYCARGSSIADLATAIRQVASGRTYWDVERLQSLVIVTSPERSFNLLRGVRESLRSSSLQQIEAALIELDAQLRSPGLSLLDKAVLTGQRRELKAARWVVKRVLSSSDSAPQPARVLPPLSEPLRSLPSSSQLVPDPPLEMTAKDLQAILFDGISAKLQSSLENLTNSPLEIDIFRAERKRELFYIVLRQIEASLEELRFSQIQPHQLVEKQSVILRDLWQAITLDFFGRYYTLRIRNQDIEVVTALLQDEKTVQTAILDKIPAVMELYAHLLFRTALTIDNTDYLIGSPDAIARATDLLENLTIQLANAVVQPLLNRFSDLEAIKQSFYDRRLLSTRDIERFRNDLSWKYRVDRYVSEPTAIFESRYSLFVFTHQGIVRIFIYAPRRHELEQLAGVRLAITLALETRDAISPRLRSAIAFLGSGVVYILTDVIGRGLGLIGRGIVKGIGNAWQDSRR